MEVKESALVQEEFPSSPYSVLQHISEEAVRVAGEALQTVYSGSPRLTPGNGHRRCRSEVVASPNGHTYGFQRLKSQMQRALNLVHNSQEQTFFNPEILANQKRQWYQFHSKSLDHRKYEEPSLLFEHFIIAGIRPDANLEVVEDAFARRKKLESQVGKSERTQYQVPSHATLDPQIFFKYPPGKRLPMRISDLASFCFPEDVKARVLEKTPSLTELNELVYGQEHLSTDNSSFIFSLKVAGDSTLYGVCLHVKEFVQRPPAIFGGVSPLSRTSNRSSRFLVSAPRCYCLLTRVPFFELHYEMLNSIIAQERLTRITEFVTEVKHFDHVPSEPTLDYQGNEDTGICSQECSAEWMDSAIPVDNAVALAAAAAGIISDNGLSSPSSRLETWSPRSVPVDKSHGSNHSKANETDKNRECLSCSDDYKHDVSETRRIGRKHGHCDNVQKADVEACVCPGSRTLAQLGSFESFFSSVRNMESDDEDGQIFSCNDKDASIKTMMEWARENRNDLLQIVCSYHAMPLPSHGSEIVFKPLEHLQAIKYQRPTVFALGRSENLGLEMQESMDMDKVKVKLKLAVLEEAVSLSAWTTATICRVLSLENVLTLLAGVLLEKQVMITCPNLGVLSATVLSLIPMLLPFEWQSLFLPVLPGKMFDFLDAPVPFVVGVQHKPTDFRMKTYDLVHVDVAKDKVTGCSLPQLPQQKELICKLGPFHARLSRERSSKGPVYRCNRGQAEAAAYFLTIIRRYLESFCTDLSSHAITSVQSNNDRVSVLLKDSFVDSFPPKDRLFVKQFVDTQMFSVLSDARLSRHENGYH